MTQHGWHFDAMDETLPHRSWPIGPEGSQTSRQEGRNYRPYVMPEPGARAARSGNTPGVWRTAGSDLLGDQDETISRARPRPRVRMAIGAGADVDMDAETIWQDPWRQWSEWDGRDGRDEWNPDTTLSGREREATTARPLVNRALIRRDDQHEPGDAHTTHTAHITHPTLTIIPATRQHVVLPAAKDQPSPSRMGRTATGVVRSLLISLVLYYVLSSGLQVVGQPGLPLAPFPWAASNGASGVIASVGSAQTAFRFDGKMASRMQPMTQMKRVDLYDSRAQFSRWAGSACSAASLAEVLTAYGLPHMTIGRIIREMGADISPTWGLLTYNAFNKVVSKYGLRADVYLANNPLSYKQMLYLTNTLGIPVLVNMRATTGYYHYLSGGHILVMTGGTSSRIHLTDSSLYYIKSLPIGTYNAMARPRNVVIVPKNFHYKLPR
ncbi:MAG TPA: hypothetical protein VJO13_09220 [Ktedonobacterales bacterium]|nr:hypothetical protein [Ktedonobacterales bacterium]